jgi:hypothetical protein
MEIIHNNVVYTGIEVFSLFAISQDYLSLRPPKKPPSSPGRERCHDPCSLIPIKTIERSHLGVVECAVDGLLADRKLRSFFVVCRSGLIYTEKVISIQRWH